MPIENISDLEKSLHLESGTLSKALENEENVTIEIPELKILKNDDYDALINNVKAEASKQGIELMLKEWKEKEGLEYDGRKKPENFINALKEKTIQEANVEPEKRYKDLKTSYGKLQDNLESVTNQFETLNHIPDTFPPQSLPLAHQAPDWPPKSWIFFLEREASVLRFELAPYFCR